MKQKPSCINTHIFKITALGGVDDCHFVSRSKSEHALLVCSSFFFLCTFFICLYLVCCCFLKCAFYQIEISSILLLICIEYLIKCLSEKDLKCINVRLLVNKQYISLARVFLFCFFNYSACEIGGRGFSAGSLLLHYVLTHCSSSSGIGPV